ncbi:proteophosphoglycan PPG1, putative [Babesia ovis]|uniref:Proteophosphoglycan PPG1, putative n=1 Tax=Babesia ovis TaxID=5869 RepID=A0A9W5TDW5_BABOV|nr:proteophosphoglycan PPG1, putative [Babesia ovis]
MACNNEDCCKTAVKNVMRCAIHGPRSKGGNPAAKSVGVLKSTENVVTTSSSIFDDPIDDESELSQNAGSIQASVETGSIKPKYPEPLDQMEVVTDEVFVNDGSETSTSSSFEKGFDKRSNEWLAAWSLNGLKASAEAMTISQEFSLSTKNVNAIKVLDYKLERSERIINVLKMQLAERDEIIAKMVKHVDMLEEWKSELDRGQNMLAIEQHHELGATINVIQEKYESKQEECLNLKNRLQEMEQNHMLKDDEMKALMIKYNELKNKEAQLEMQLEAATADRLSFSTSVQKLKQSFEEQHLDAKVAMDKEYQKQIVYLLGQIDEYKKQVVEKDAEIEQRNSQLRKAENEIAKLVEMLDKLRSNLRDKDAYNRSMREAMLDLEEQLFKDGQNASARISAALAVLEGTRSDNVELKSKNRALQKELDQCRMQLSTISAKSQQSGEEK